MAHIRQSWPDSGLDFQVKVLGTFWDIPSSLGSGSCILCRELDDDEGVGPAPGARALTFCRIYDIFIVYT